MLPAILGNRVVLPTVACYALLTAGCAGPMAPSQRLHEHVGPIQRSTPIRIGGHQIGMKGADGCDSCVERQRLKDYVHHAAPYVAGPFHQQLDGSNTVPAPPTIQPPHSKFHPVPTRPVFETRASYISAQPHGVHLVPIPEDEYFTERTLRQPQQPLGEPPTPRVMQVDPLRSRTTDDAGTFMLPPPSE